MFKFKRIPPAVISPIAVAVISISPLKRLEQSLHGDPACAAVNESEQFDDEWRGGELVADAPRGVPQGLLRLEQQPVRAPQLGSLLVAEAAALQSHGVQSEQPQRVARCFDERRHVLA